MTRRLVAAAAVLLVACSSLGEGNGAVSIEIFTPSPASVEVGDTITMRARLLDINGDSIAGTIRWRTPDTTLTIDSINGHLSGLIATTGRIQAVSGSLVVPNPPLLFTIRPHADTLIVPAATDTLQVAPADSQTTALNPKVTTAAGAANVQDATLIFTMLFPADSSALLNGSVKADTVLTGSSGEPAVTMRVKQHGAVRPDSAVIRVDARRPSGAVVPGSGQLIRVIFQ